MIRFLGKRSNLPTPAETPINAPKAHPQAPTSLPSSFLQYRQNAQTHGPLGGKGSATNSRTVGTGPSAAQSIGEYSSRSALPPRFRYSAPSEEEMANINAGGAEIVF